MTPLPRLTNMPKLPLSSPSHSAIEYRPTLIYFYFVSSFIWQQLSTHTHCGGQLLLNLYTLLSLGSKKRRSSHLLLTPFWLQGLQIISKNIYSLSNIHKEMQLIKTLWMGVVISCSNPTRFLMYANTLFVTNIKMK